MDDTKRRQGHKKSKRGCRTCKIRHVKCDEFRPHCLRCTRSGRVCDGYEDVRTAAAAPEQLRPLRWKPLQLPPVMSPFRLPLFSSSITGSAEMRALEHFRERTLPALQACFQRETWTSLVFSLLNTTPALFHACVAVSTFHELVETCGSLSLVRKDIFEEAQRHKHDFAIRHYLNALRETRSSITADQTDTVALKLSCLLFNISEELQGHRLSARSHLESGIRMLNDTPSATQENSDIDAVLRRLSLSQSLYGRPRRSGFVPVPWKRPVLDAPFDSLQDARDAITTLTAQTLSFVQTRESAPSREHAAQRQTRLEITASLAQWEQALAPIRTALANDLASSAACKVMLAQKTMARIFLDNTKTCRQTGFDEYVDDYAHVTMLLEQVLSEPTNMRPIRVFCWDTCIWPVLVYTTIRCRHPSVRRRARHLMTLAPAHEGLWNANEAMQAVDLAISFEERFVTDRDRPRLRDEWRTMIPEHARTADVDIRSEMDGDDQGLSFVLYRFYFQGDAAHSVELTTFVVPPELARTELPIHFQRMHPGPRIVLPLPPS